MPVFGSPPADNARVCVLIRQYLLLQLLGHELPLSRRRMSEFHNLAACLSRLDHRYSIRSISRDQEGEVIVSAIVWFADCTRKVHLAVHRHLLNWYPGPIKPARPRRALQPGRQDLQAGPIVNAHLLAQVPRVVRNAKRGRLDGDFRTEKRPGDQKADTNNVPEKPNCHCRPFDLVPAF